jgi:CRP-like cAMP-binding protein
MITEADAQVARSALLFSSLPRDLSETLMKRALRRSAGRGETLFLQGEAASSVFVVLDGWIKLFRIAPSGAEAVVGVFTRGGSFGEAAAFQGGGYPVSAEAVTDCAVLQLRAATLIETMHERPELCAAMLGATFKHLHALVAQVEALKALSGAQRVAEFLADLCPVQEGACAVTLPYDKTLIAGRLGMKPESLSRAFARLRDHGVMIRNNQAAIADVAALRELAEEDRAASWGG